jgi:hypothetical protein
MIDLCSSMDRAIAEKRPATPRNTRKQTNQMNRPTKPPPKNAAKNETVRNVAMVSTPVDPVNITLFARTAR